MPDEMGESETGNLVAALQAAEERYRALLDEIPLPTFVYDVKTLRYLAVNQAAIDSYGYSREEFLAMRVTDIRPIEDVDRLLHSFETLDSHPRRLGIWRHRKKDGTLLEADIVSKDATESGRPARLIIATDVTARERMERALGESERRFRSLIEHATDPIFIVGRDTAIRYASPAAERVLGMSAQALEGFSMESLLHPDDLPGARQTFASLLATPGGTTSSRYRVRRSDGAYRTLSAVSHNLLGDAAIGGLVINARDITNESALEEQLRQSQKLEAVGRLAGGIAHDFNNILTVITNFAEFMLEDLPQGSPACEDAEHIQKAARRAITLTRQMLAFSRRQLMQPRVLDPNQLIADLDKLLRPLIGEHVELETRLAPGISQVAVDPGQLEQVLLNLVINARDAMPAGGRLRIETNDAPLDESYAALHPDVSPGTYVMLAVSDTGVGMDEATRRRAFEPFFTTKAERGTGLGLASVYGIVKQCGGHVWLYSEPGRGSTFKVYLPAARREAAVAPLPPPGQSVSRGDEAVLVVEDDPLVRETVQAALQRSGYRVLIASNGDEAMALARGTAGGIDLLLTDIVMPRTDGRVVARKLCQEQPSLRVVFMSGYTENAMVDQGIVEAGIDFIEKPFTLQALLRKVREALSRPPPPAG